MGALFQDSDQLNCQLSVESQPVKIRLGGLCKMAASLGPSSLRDGEET
jgi:hypothetical protein